MRQRSDRKRAKQGKQRTPRTLADLTPDPQSARRHPARNVAMIGESLDQVGAARSIVIDEAGVVRAGNAVREQALARGMKLLVVDADGHTLVAVRRRGLTADQKTRLALYDNRTGELATWDPEVLRALQDAGVNLTGCWSDDELLGLFAETPRPGLTDPDATPALRRTSITAGDVFALGRHRLTCGDSTSAEVVESVLAGARPRLMVTDPPYGVRYDPEWRQQAGVNRSARMGKVANDDRADWTEAWRLFPGDVAYVWHAALFASTVDASLAACDFRIRSQIVWRKARLVLSRGHYHWQHEPCWYAVRHGRGAQWAGKRNQTTAWAIEAALQQCPACGTTSAAPTSGIPTTVWDIETKDDTGTTTHGTQKPVECMARAMRNHLAPDVYEPFSGSGSSLIAAELLERRCYAVELDPGYVQQAIDRWQAFTGKTAVKAGQILHRPRHPHPRRHAPL